MTAQRQLSLISAALLVGCSTPSSHRDKLSDAQRVDPEFVSTTVLAEVQAIRLDDGVDVSEANVLAGHYFRNTYGACGMWGPARERKKEWYFPCAVGVIPGSKPGITVAKQGLLITCSSGPVVTNATLLAKPYDPVWRGSPLNPRRK
jgi:hypothetical protein